MENTIFGGGQTPSPAYDFRIYDQVWQRVVPGVDPYAAESIAPRTPRAEPAQVPAAIGQAAAGQAAAGQAAVGQTAVEQTAAASQTAAGQAAIEQAEGSLPGAERNPCCMGTEAQSSVEILEGFIEEELAGQRCCVSLACCVRNPAAARLLRRIACEKRAAVRELCGAYYLITGQRCTTAVTVEHTRFGDLAQALRSCYHQEACAGFNYQRAADEAADPCLQKLLNRLGAQSYRRAEDVLTLLGTVVS